VQRDTEVTTDAPEPADEDEIRPVVARLARPHRSGGRVIERAAILAEGTNSTAIMAYITAHDWEPEADEAAPSSGAGFGLHAARREEQRATSRRAPRRYVERPTGG